MLKLPGISHSRAVSWFPRGPLWKHNSMTKGGRIIIIPGANPIDGFTMGGIIRDAGMTVEEFKKLS